MYNVTTRDSPALHSSRHRPILFIFKFRECGDHNHVRKPRVVVERVWGSSTDAFHALAAICLFLSTANTWADIKLQRTLEANGEMGDEGEIPGIYY